MSFYFRKLVTKMPEAEEKWQYEILERLARIEENTKNLDTVSENARTALARSEENTKDIEEMKENQKWTWRTVVGIGVSIFVYLATTYLGRK